MIDFAPVHHMPGSVGAAVALQSGQFGALYDSRQKAGALYLADRVMLVSSHSAVTLDQVRAAIGLLTQLADLMQATPPTGV